MKICSGVGCNALLSDASLFCPKCGIATDSQCDDPPEPSDGDPSQAEPIKVFSSPERFTGTDEIAGGEEIGHVRDGFMFDDKVSLWNPMMASVIGLFIGLPFCSYIHYRNWSALGFFDKATISKLWFQASVILLLASFFVPYYYPVFDAISTILVFCIFIAWYIVAGKEQEIFFKKNIDGHFKTKSLIGPAAVYVLMMATLITSIAYLYDDNAIN
jgi:hypothetical protein